MTGMSGVILCGGRPTSVQLAPVDHQERYRWCCLGAAEDGARFCTCWRPEYDEEQAEPQLDVAPGTRTAMCGDCAYKPDSPERLGKGGDYGLEGLDNFWCHRGIRRPARWRHPDGRVRPGNPADYDPPVIDGVPYRADGRPAERCGGWAAVQRGVVSDVRSAPTG